MVTVGHESADHPSGPFLTEVLIGPDFSPVREALISPDRARELLSQRHRGFNLQELDNDTAVEMAEKALTLRALARKALELKTAGQIQEAAILTERIRLVADPGVSQVQTPVRNVLEVTHGDLDMASSFLGIKPQIGRSWLNFIVRTWGQKPSDFR